MRNNIAKLLYSIGMRDYYLGFEYWIDILEYALINNMTIHDIYIQDIYNIFGDIHGKTNTAIERDLRTARQSLAFPLHIPNEPKITNKNLLIYLLKMYKEEYNNE